jgi:hypothetical protein
LVREYEGYDERFKREAIAPFQTRSPIPSEPVVRNILGQVKSKVSIPFIMDNQRLFIANLSKGSLGHEKANLLGSLLTTQFQLAAMARSNQREEERRDFYLFIDEFQNFSTDAFASILSEARKYRSCLILSHQYIDQLPLPIRQAILAMSEPSFRFRIGYADAEVLKRNLETRSLRVRSLISIGTRPSSSCLRMERIKSHSVQKCFRLSKIGLPERNKLVMRSRERSR